VVHGSSVPVWPKRRWRLSRSLTPGPASASPPTLLGRARPEQSTRRAECWRCGVDGGPFGWKPGPGDSSVDVGECHSWQSSRHEGPQDTEVAPAAAARGHENGPRRRAPGVLPGTQAERGNVPRSKTRACVDQTRSPTNHPQPRPASTLVAANFFVRRRCCARARSAAAFQPP
jgi:hypothetical protein